jgi:hypothetical protein
MVLAYKGQAYLGMSIGERVWFKPPHQALMYQCVHDVVPYLINASMNYIGYKKKKMSTDMESGRGNKRAKLTRGSRNPKHGGRKPLHCAQT